MIFGCEKSQRNHGSSVGKARVSSSLLGMNRLNTYPNHNSTSGSLASEVHVKRSETVCQMNAKEESDAETANAANRESADLVLANGSRITLLSSSTSPPISISDILNIYSKPTDSPTYQKDAQESTLGYPSPMTTSDFVSPMPQFTFSPSNKETVLLSNRREKVLEELVESEANYVTSLKLLLNFYIEPLCNSKYKSEVILSCRCYLEALQKNHSRLLMFMNSTLAEVNLRSNSSLAAAALVSGICEYGVDVTTYEEFLVVYEDIIKILKHSPTNIKTGTRSSKDIHLQRQLISGTEAYLEATQPSTKRMDLSFFSLMQRPVSRIPKYRLMLESLLKCTFELDQNYSCMLNCLVIVRSRLTKINESSKRSQAANISDKLSTLLNLERPIEFFGRCNLSGSMVCAWVTEGGNIVKCHTSILCFKSHLILSSMNSHQQHTSESSKFKVEFVLPFISCRVLSRYKESDDFGGLTTEYPFSLKLQFENNYSKYEILLIAMDTEELHIWEENLQTYIYLNGENKFDYSYSKTNELQAFVKHPENLSPFDIYLTKSSPRSVSRCYFSEVLRIGVEVFGDGKYRGKRNAASVEIKSNERIEVEEALEEVWSQELPKLKERSEKSASTWRWGNGKSRGHADELKSLPPNKNGDDTKLNGELKKKASYRRFGLFQRYH